MEKFIPRLADTKAFPLDAQPSRPLGAWRWDHDALAEQRHGGALVLCHPNPLDSQDTPPGGMGYGWRAMFELVLMLLVVAMVALLLRLI